MVIIDNSSAFRYDDRFPLVVPEINAAAAFPPGGPASPFVANPNCTTAIGVMALWPLHCKYGLKKVIMSTYQAASGAGAEGMAELKRGTQATLDAEKRGFAAPRSHKVFAHPLQFNVIPHVDKFQENGYTKEEMKVVWETHKIFSTANGAAGAAAAKAKDSEEEEHATAVATAKDIKVSCTCVRVPTLRAHSEAITVETTHPITVAGARALLESAPGVKVVDDLANNVYPMPLNASGEYDVEVGRIRQSLIFGDNGLDLFVVGDQLLKGAALNAVQIAEAWLTTRQG